MALTTDNLNDALAAYGLLKKGKKAYALASVETFALPAYNTCIPAVVSALDYVINNGYDNKAVMNTLTKGVDTAYDLIGLRNTDASSSRFRKLSAAATELRRTAPTSSNSLEINRMVNECVKSTADALKAMKEDMNEVDEAEYKKINEEYLQRSSYPTIEQWGSTVKSVVKDVTSTLNDIKESLTKVVDNSSAAALQTARQIIDDIMVWRNAAVYSYLMLETSMADALHEARDIARSWSTRYTGVSKNKTNPRAEDGDLLVLNAWQNDQMQLYLQAYKG